MTISDVTRESNLTISEAMCSIHLGLVLEVKRSRHNGVWRENCPIGGLKLWWNFSLWL